MRADISIIVPVFNTEKIKLQRMTASVLRQNFSNFELILVDDCSADDCRHNIEEIAHSDSRIKIICNQTHIGCPQSRAAGLLKAQGHYILMADSDDFLEDNMLEMLYEHAVKTGADMVYCDYYRHGSDSVEKIEHGKIVDKNLFYRDMFAHRTWGLVWNKLVRRELYEKVSFPLHFSYEDEVQTVQLIFYAEKLEYVARPLYHYYDHTELFDNRQWHTAVEQYINYQQIISFIETHFPDGTAVLEPELSFRINRCKAPFVAAHYSQARKIMLGLYPPSINFIFQSVRINILKKLMCLSIYKNMRITWAVLKFVFYSALFFRNRFRFSSLRPLPSDIVLMTQC